MGSIVGDFFEIDYVDEERQFVSPALALSDRVHVSPEALPCATRRFFSSKFPVRACFDTRESPFPSSNRFYWQEAHPVPHEARSLSEVRGVFSRGTPAGNWE